MVQPGPGEDTGWGEYHSRNPGVLGGAMEMDDGVVMEVPSRVAVVAGLGLELGLEPEPALALVVEPAVAEQPRFVVAVFAVVAV